jgi:hypothetical protein
MIKYITIKDILQKFNEENFIPYENVTDEQIKYYIDNNLFIDVLKTRHNGDKDSTNIHAQRIASLCNLIQNNCNINPIEIYVVKNGMYEVDDGYHRLRAYYYLDNLGLDKLVQ